MVVKPGFELGLTKSKIAPCWVVGSCNGGFVNDGFGSAFAVKRAFKFYSAVAWHLVGMGGWVY